MDFKPVRQEEDSFSLGAALTRHRDTAQTLTFKFGPFLAHLLPIASCVRRFRKNLLNIMHYILCAADSLVSM
jgi:hypothetical protein